MARKSTVKTGKTGKTGKAEEELKQKVSELFREQIPGIAETEVGFQALLDTLGPEAITNLCRTSKEITKLCKSKKWDALIKKEFPVLMKHLSKFRPSIGDSPAIRSWNWHIFEQHTPAWKYYFLKRFREYLAEMERRGNRFLKKSQLAGWTTLTDEDYEIYTHSNPFDLLYDERGGLDAESGSLTLTSREEATNNLNLLIWLLLQADGDKENLLQATAEDLYARYEGSAQELPVNAAVAELVRIGLLDAHEVPWMTWQDLGDNIESRSAI